MKLPFNFFSRDNLQHASLSSSALLFIVRWLSISVILFSSEILIRYGLIGLIRFIILFAISLSIFGFLGQRLRLRYDQQASLLSIIEMKSTRLAALFYKNLIFILSLGLLFIQIFSVHLMLISILDIPIFLTQSLFLLACFLYLLFSRPKFLNRIEPVIIVMIVFMTIILIPVYNFVQKGIEPVFNGIWLYHPYLLFWKTNESTSFFITIFLLLLGIILLDFVSWNRLFSLQIPKISRTLSISGFLLAMILFGLSSLLLIALSNKSFDNPSTILFSLIEDLQTSVLKVLFITFSMIISFSVICMEIRFISTLCRSRKILPIKNHKTIHLLMIVTILAFASFLCRFLAPMSIMKIFIFYGVICTALIPIILSIIFSRIKLNHIHIFGTIFSVGTGFVFFNLFDEFTAIWGSFGLSAMWTLLITAQFHIRDSLK